MTTTKKHTRPNATCETTHTHAYIRMKNQNRKKITILGHDEIVHKILKFYLVALTTLHRVRSGNIIFICKQTNKQTPAICFPYCFTLFPLCLTLSHSLFLSVFLFTFLCFFPVVLLVIRICFGCAMPPICVYICGFKGGCCSCLHFYLSSHFPPFYFLFSPLYDLFFPIKLFLS